MRQTSIDVFNRIEAEGLLTGLRLLVYKIVTVYGPITQGETWHKLLETEFHNMPSVTPRFAELESLGVIMTDGVKKCEVSGESCIAWVTTDKFPVKIQKRKTKTETIYDLQVENGRLKAQIETLSRAITQMPKQDILNFG